MFYCVIYLIPITIGIFLLGRYILRRRIRKNTIAFFHLYCSSGGGGERVLWNTIATIFERYPKYTVYIYSHKSIHNDSLQVLLKVRETFQINLVSDPNLVDRLEFIPLRFSSLVEASNYPFLTLLFQSVGSVILAVEAVIRLAPEVYAETIGFSFTLPVFKFQGSSVITYVHYPTISNDMIQNVRTSTHASFNNREVFTRSPLLRNFKLLYYRLMAYLYGYCGRHADLVMVNSSWTQGHIEYLWATKTHIVHPPCDVNSFRQVNSVRTPTDGDSKCLNIISIAQFRPEKRHKWQIEAFDQFLSKSKAYGSKLTLYGGCRDDSDRYRIDELKDLIKTLDLASSVNIVVNAPFDSLLEGLRDANVALHTMENEHFGIVLLECMAAGLIMVAHESGGPKMDIIRHGESGFLAKDVADYANRLVDISKMSLEQREQMRLAAGLRADQFSNENFKNKFIELTKPLLLAHAM